MKKLTIMAGLIFGFWLIMSVPAHAQVLGDARLSLIQGDVAIQNGDTGSEWGTASINMPLPPGTKLWAPEGGRFEAQFLGGSYLRGDANTEADITNLSMGDGGSTIQVGVPQGNVFVTYAGSNVRDAVFQVDTPGASVMAYEPSRFEVYVDQGGHVEVSAVNGKVYVQSQTGSTEVPAGSMLALGPDQAPELSPARPEDAWLRWNISRDAALAYRGASRGYLPASLSVYDNDFNTYGRWVRSPDYGYVWTPLHVSLDWAPYRVGRWCWVGGDYVWVSYEPWGWAPYHYGRWTFSANIGWCWVPPSASAVFWSPGFVAWISTPTYVSWVPLAPGEIYYGHGYYGPHSVNITNVNIKNIHITNTYVNARHPYAATVVSRETFVTGRRERVKGAPSNPFRAGVKVHPGRPEIRPVLATALPHPSKAVPQRALPPREVRERVRVVEHRPVAVRHDVSVFRQGNQVPSMHVNKVEAPKPMRGHRPELGQQEQGKERRERLPAQGQERGAPSIHRETGVAPSFHEGQGKPPATRPAPQREKGVSSHPEREMKAPSNHKEHAAPPSTQGEMGVAPSFHEGHGKYSASRPVPQQERGAHSQPERQMKAPSNHKEHAAPPSAQREMGVAPSFHEGHGKSSASRPVPQQERGAHSHPERQMKAHPHRQDHKG